MIHFLKAITLFLSITLITACTSAREFMKESGDLIGAVAGAYVGHKLGKDSKYASEIMALTTIAGTYLGGKLAAQLKKEDQEKLALSTQAALVSGQDSTWKSDDTNVSGSSKVVSTESKAEPIKVKVLKSKVKKVPPLDIIGATYLLKDEKYPNGGNMRGGPAMDYVIVGKILKEEPVQVVGKAKETNWYLISKDGVGSGFAHQNLLREAPLATVEINPENIDASDVAEQEIATNRICRTVENSVQLADGSTLSETVNACQGANGWEIESVV